MYQGGGLTDDKFCTYFGTWYVFSSSNCRFLLTFNLRRCFLRVGVVLVWCWHWFVRVSEQQIFDAEEFTFSNPLNWNWLTRIFIVFLSLSWYYSLRRRRVKSVTYNLLLTERCAILLSARCGWLNCCRFYHSLVPYVRGLSISESP